MSHLTYHSKVQCIGGPKNGLIVDYYGNVYSPMPVDLPPLYKPGVGFIPRPGSYMPHTYRLQKFACDGKTPRPFYVSAKLDPAEAAKQVALIGYGL